MSSQESKIKGDESSRPAVQESAVGEARDRLAGLLPDDALQDALNGLEPDEITGPGGLVSQLAGRVVETALGAELTEHLGYRPGQAPPGGAGNHRNGHTAKTVQTELGPVPVKTPRDRRGTFEPALVGKRQTRLAGLDEKILGLYAGGMTVRDIAAHLSDLYGVEVGRDTISRVTDAVLEDVEAWRTRPLEAVYPIVSFDALRVKVREDRSVRNPRLLPRARGHVRRRARGAGDLVAGDRGRQVLAGRAQRPAPPRRRRRPDQLRRRPQGLPGGNRGDVPQTRGCRPASCISSAASLRYVNYRDLKKVTSALRPIYTAANADAALSELARFDADWGARYPATVRAWRDAWEHVVPFLSLPEELRKAVYTTNTIEGLHRQIRKAIKTRGHFPDQQAATKLIYLAIIKADAKWQRNRTWSAPRAALKIHFGDRYPG